MAKCCVVFSQSPFEDLTVFRVRHILLLRDGVYYGENDVTMELHYQLWSSIIRFMELHKTTYGVPYSMYTLKRKCPHFDEIFITGCTESCQNDNLQCSQWWKFRQNDDIFVSV